MSSDMKLKQLYTNYIRCKKDNCIQLCCLCRIDADMQLKACTDTKYTARPRVYQAQAMSNLLIII